MRVAVVGGGNQVSAFLIPKLLSMEVTVVVYSQGPPPPWIKRCQGLTWHGAEQRKAAPVDALIYLAPLAFFADFHDLFRPLRRAVVFSSTSRFSKDGSDDRGERQMARAMAEDEARIVGLAEPGMVTLLRPTLIYGAGLDQNLTRVAGWIARTRRFPLQGAAAGLRQPVHAADLAQAAATLALGTEPMRQSYALGGASTLSYREMIAKVFTSLDLPARFIRIPRWLIRAGLGPARALGWTDLNPVMFDRMNTDLVVDYQAATDDFDYRPRPFAPDAETWRRLDRRAAES